MIQSIRRKFYAIIAWFWCISFVIVLSSCNARNARTAMDFIDAACIVAMADLSTKEVLTVCGLEQDLSPIIDKWLAKHRAIKAAHAAASASNSASGSTSNSVSPSATVKP